MFVYLSLFLFYLLLFVSNNRLINCFLAKHTVRYTYIQGVKKVPDPKQNYIGLMTEG